MFGEPLVANAVKRGEIAQAPGAGVGSGPGATGLDGRNHHVLCRVLRGDELKDLGAVAGPFEQLGAQRIGDKFRLALLKNSVVQGVGEDRRGGELRPEFLLAARRHHEQSGSGGNAAGERIVGRGVAGMERDEHVAGAERGFVD